MESTTPLAVRSNATSSRSTTRALLACGVAAGPLFYVVAAAQILTRPGFDIRRHAISMLSLGDWGWVQVANFVVTALLALACAAGMRRVLRGGPGGTWGPALVGVFGVGLLLGAAFRPDAGLGFPPGTPDTIPTTMSAHAALHMLGGMTSLLAVVVDCFVLGRLFASLGKRHWLTYCYASVAGTVVLVALSLSISSLAGILFAGGAGVAFAWVSVIAGRLRAGAC
jgi:Protein of unknown function (DUF998)